MNETFTCQSCGYSGNIKTMKLRLSMPGEFCTSCAKDELCGCCLELTPRTRLTWNTELNNFVCNHCANEANEEVQPVYSWMEQKPATV